MLQKDHTHFPFFVDFQWNMLRDSFSFNKLCCNPVVLKKIGKISNKLHFGPTLHKKGVIMGHIQNENNFFWAEITKADHQLSKTFYFIKISCFGWVTNLFLSWVIFLVKKVSFPTKTAGGKVGGSECSPRPLPSSSIGIHSYF